MPLTKNTPSFRPAVHHTKKDPCLLFQIKLDSPIIHLNVIYVIDLARATNHNVKSSTDCPRYTQ